MSKLPGLQERVQLREGDIATLPFDDERFVLVVSNLSLHHWLHPVIGLREICRVLKPEGVALIYDMPAWFARPESHGPLIEEMVASGVLGEVKLEGFVRVGPVPVLVRLTIHKDPSGA